MAESSASYGKRGEVYDEIIVLLDKLPNNVIEHYRTLLAAEVRIKDKEKGR